jgi:hypothetical protein
VKVSNPRWPSLAAASVLGVLGGCLDPWSKTSCNTEDDCLDGRVCVEGSCRYPDADGSTSMDQDGSSSPGTTDSSSETTTGQGTSSSSTSSEVSGDSQTDTSTGTESDSGTSQDSCCIDCPYACDEACECWLVYDSFETTFEPWSFEVFVGPVLTIVELGANGTEHSLRLEQSANDPLAYTTRPLPIPVESLEIDFWFGLGTSEFVLFGVGGADAYIPAFELWFARTAVAIPEGAALDYPESATGWYHVELVVSDLASESMTIRVNGLDVGQTTYDVPAVETLLLMADGGAAIIDEFRLR